jgi:hypothetical protein
MRCDSIQDSSRAGLYTVCPSSSDCHKTHYNFKDSIHVCVGGGQHLVVTVRQPVEVFKKKLIFFLNFNHVSRSL